MQSKHFPPEQAAAKAAILAECDRLAEGGIAFVAVHFDDSGDEGVSDDIKCCITEDYAYEESEAQQANVSHLQQHFEALVPYGYENDCDGFGDVILNVKTRKIAIERNDRFEDYTTSSLELRGLTIAHPMKHAESSAGRFGGRAEDYLPIHNWFDESKVFMADFRHRALRHHAEGIFLCERIFGAAITNSEGKKVPVRYIGEQHVARMSGAYPLHKTGYRKSSPFGGCAASVLSSTIRTPSLTESRSFLVGQESRRKLAPFCWRKRSAVCCEYLDAKVVLFPLHCTVSVVGVECTKDPDEYVPVTLMVYFPVGVPLLPPPLPPPQATSKTMPADSMQASAVAIAPFFLRSEPRPIRVATNPISGRQNA